MDDDPLPSLSTTQVPMQVHASTPSEGTGELGDVTPTQQQFFTQPTQAPWSPLKRKSPPSKKPTKKGASQIH